jgi:hypothetical protein
VSREVKIKPLTQMKAEDVLYLHQRGELPQELVDQLGEENLRAAQAGEAELEMPKSRARKRTGRASDDDSDDDDDDAEASDDASDDGDEEDES